MPETVCPKCGTTQWVIQTVEGGDLWFCDNVIGKGCGCEFDPRTAWESETCETCRFTDPEGCRWGPAMRGHGRPAVVSATTWQDVALDGSVRIGSEANWYPACSKWERKEVKYA